MKIYLDTNFFIRYVESKDVELISFIARASSRTWQLSTIEFTLAEVLVLPLRTGDKALTEIYEAMLASDKFLYVAPIDRTVVRQTAQVRAFIGNQPADALHVATAINTSCSIFLSSDRRLRVPDIMRRVSLESVGTIDLS